MRSGPSDGRAPRFPQLKLEQLTPEQRPLGEKIVAISSVGLGGPYNPMIRSPVMAQRLYDLLDYLRWHSTVPTRLTGFAILIQGRLWRSQVEWYAHYPLAIKAGLSPEVAADLKAGRRPAAMTDDEAAVYDFCMELSTRHAVSDDTYARTKAVLGEQGIVDLTALSGTYVTVAMLLAMAEETVPPGKEPPFKPGEDLTTSSRLASRHPKSARPVPVLDRLFGILLERRIAWLDPRHDPGGLESFSIRWTRSGGTGSALSIADANGWTRSGQSGSYSQSAVPQPRQKLRSPVLVRHAPVSSSRISAR